MASVPKTNRCLPASEAVVDPSQARTSLGHAVDLKLGRRISLGIECRRVVRQPAARRIIGVGDLRIARHRKRHCGSSASNGPCS
jgi:hypothetical protein